MFDADGTLTGLNQSAYITPYYRYFDYLINNHHECIRHPGLDYDDSVVCTVILRRVLFRNMIPVAEFKGMGLRVLNL